MKYQGGWVGSAIGLAKVGAIIGVALFIYHVGKNSADAEWQPKYNKLETSYTEYRANALQWATQAKGEADTLKATIVGLKKTSGERYAKKQAENNALIDKYIANLDRLRAIQATRGVSTGSGGTGSLRDAAIALGCTGTNGTQFANGLGLFEVRVIRDIIARGQAATNRALECKQFLEEQEKEMEIARQRYEAAMTLINDGEGKKND